MRVANNSVSLTSIEFWLSVLGERWFLPSGHSNSSIRKTLAVKFIAESNDRLGTYFTYYRQLVSDVSYVTMRSSVGSIYKLTQHLIYISERTCFLFRDTIGQAMHNMGVFSTLIFLTQLNKHFLCG